MKCKVNMNVPLFWMAYNHLINKTTQCICTILKDNTNILM